MLSIGRVVIFVPKKTFFKAYSLRNHDLLLKQKAQVETLIDSYSQIPTRANDKYKQKVQNYFRNALQSINSEEPNRI